MQVRVEIGGIGLSAALRGGLLPPSSASAENATSRPVLVSFRNSRRFIGEPPFAASSGMPPPFSAATDSMA